MNDMSELMKKLQNLRKQRAILILWLLILLVILGIIRLRPNETQDLREENRLLRRYALRIETQNEKKDKLIMQLSNRILAESKHQKVSH